jgi:nicotinamide-nucleotide amidase
VIAEVIAVGSELIHGLVRNTNLDLISELLAEAGIRPSYHTTVGDEPEHLGDALRTAVRRSDLVILTGGLGPTADDITRKVIATVFRRRLILDPVVLDQIRARFQARGIEMPPINESQALVPRGADVIENPVGSAPGLHFSHLETECFALPGVPSEAEAMLRATVIPFVKSRNPGLVSGIRMVRTIGIGESALAEKLAGFELEEPDLALGTIARVSGVDLHLSASSVDAMWLQGVLDRGERKLLERAQPHAYALGRRTLSEVVGEALIQRRLTIATGESFTGGEVGALLVATPGSSRYYKGGVIAYANDAKESLLGVSKETLRRHGAVSEEVAVEMARGARDRLGATCAVSTTGIAGPDGGTAEKPVGLLFVGYAGPEGETAERFVFGGSRGEIIARGAFYALDLARRSLGVEVEWSEPSSRS